MFPTLKDLLTAGLGFGEDSTPPRNIPEKKPRLRLFGRADQGWQNPTQRLSRRRFEGPSTAPPRDKEEEAHKS